MKIKKTQNGYAEHTNRKELFKCLPPTLLSLFLFVTLFLLFSCDTTEPPDNKLETTSHNFSWQKWNFGGKEGSCSLRDVAIVNENDIWAVGEINIADTSRNGYTTYNAVHWDGSSWELKRIANSSYRRTTVFAFASNDVWFDGTIHWDGIQYTVKNNGFPLDSNGYGWRINSMWGVSSSDFYVVGNGGNIAHYKNGSWSKLQNENTDDITDIFSAESFIAAATAKKLLQIEGTNVSELMSWDSNIRTLWLSETDNIYVGGDSLYLTNDLSNWKNVTPPNQKFLFKIRGAAKNNIIATGGFGYTAHYNGADWAVLEETKLNHGNYESVSFKDKTVVLVGFEGNSAVLMLGKQN